MSYGFYGTVIKTLNFNVKNLSAVVSPNVCTDFTFKLSLFEYVKQLFQQQNLPAVPFAFLNHMNVVCSTKYDNDPHLLHLLFQTLTKYS